MRRYRTVIIIGLLGIIPMLAAVFAVRLFFPGETTEPVRAQEPVQAAAVVVQEPPKRIVLAAARDLPVGTLLGEDDVDRLGLKHDTVRRDHIAEDELDTIGAPYGHVVRKPLAAGDPLTRPGLIGPRQRGFLAAVLKPGMRAITIRLGAGTRHSGLVDPGDHVDVVLTARSVSGSGQQTVLSRTILEDARVLAIDRLIGKAAPGSPEDDAVVVRTEIVTATLEVRPSQIGLLALGEHEGELVLAVRPLATEAVKTGSSENTNPHDLLSTMSGPEAPPSLQRTVRVIRGTTVSGETFEADTGRSVREGAANESGQ